MIQFASFYFLFVLSTYIIEFFNFAAISALLLSYFSILYYFSKYIKTDSRYPFKPEGIDCLIIALFAFEFDNIIHIYSTHYRFLPDFVRVEVWICLVFIVLCVASFFKDVPVLSRHNLFVICILTLFLNLLFIYFGAKPVIDGYVHLKEAAGYFLSGRNPYSSIYTQVYSPEQVKIFYYDNPIFLQHVPFLSVPPVSIALHAVGRVLGDIRTINAILFCMGPILLKSICSKIFPDFSDNDQKKMALIILIFPAQLYLIFWAWTDIILGFFLLLFIYLFLNKQDVASYFALGIFLSLKQYSVIYAIPFLFFMNLKDWKLYLVTGGVIIIPLAFYALWDLNGFIDSIILYELKQPFRTDSFSITGLMVRNFGMKVFFGILLSIFIMLVSFVVTVYISIKKRLTLDTGYKQMRFMLYVILFQFANFLMFSKQSFLNQYYFLTFVFYLTMLFSIHPFSDASNLQVNKGN
ncbi:hypothetical protein ACFL7E_04060 [Thermodesulfobacteriota bacterium]